MAYYNELSFASGYYHIDSHGIVTLSEDMPREMEIRFWKTWVPFREKVISLEKEGRYYSCYPWLPMDDQDPNYEQYRDLLCQ